MNTIPTRPIIPYYGGKWKIAPWITSHFPPHKVYTETFGGAGSCLMVKKPAAREVYNDLNGEIVNLFEVLRSPELSNQLTSQLNLTPYSREEWEKAHEYTLDPVEQARRTIIMFIMSFNAGKAILRKNTGFKVYTKDRNLPTYFRNHTAALHLIVERLQHVIIEKQSAVKTMQYHDATTTLHYVDPPYLQETRKDNTNLYRFELLSTEEHIELAQALKELKGYVFLSGYQSPIYQELFGESGWKAVSTQSADGSTKKGRCMRTEVLWMNPAAASIQNQKNLFNQ